MRINGLVSFLENWFNENQDSCVSWLVQHVLLFLFNDDDDDSSGWFGQIIRKLYQKLRYFCEYVINLCVFCFFS